MQPVVISHGAMNNKMVHSSFAMELASLGFCVITVTHNDGSADYSPTYGYPELDSETFNYGARNKQINKRTTEIQRLVREICEPNRLSEFGPDWSHARLQQNLILMGHSFGALTMLSAARGLADKCPAVIALDPWFFALQDDDRLRLHESQKARIILTQNFPAELRNLDGGKDYYNEKQVAQFATRHK